MRRRKFLKNTSSSLAGIYLSPQLIPNHKSKDAMLKPIHIDQVSSNFVREPLARPFGFKGGHITGVWQAVSQLKRADGSSHIGLGAQSVLWSDSRVAARHSENGGNALMYAMTERALQMIKGQTFSSPVLMLDEILEEVLAYGKKITGQDDLRKTFALNALVSVDNAAWLMYAQENNINQFDAMVPTVYQGGLSARHKKVAAIPALGYGTAMETIKKLADNEFFIMKIKIGAPGNQAEMLEKDKEFISNIHDTIGHYETSHTSDGKIPYYFDANGRYQKQETLLKFLDHADQIGALDQIAVVEEPFGEHNQDDVSQITAMGPRVAADESAHTDEDTIARIEQGYNCIALKCIAKTLSMTMKMAQVAYERNIPCFCADLTVNPILVDWNKTVAARLPSFPELKFGLQETNGWQNYKHWDRMLERHPMKDAPWVKSKNGVYETGQEFMEKSGGIFEESPFYKKLMG